MTQEIPVKKKNSKIVIALAVICVVLASSLVGVIALYQPNNSQSQLTDKDNTISALRAQLLDLQNQLVNSPNDSQQVAYLYQQVSDLNSSLISANTSVYALQQIANLSYSSDLYDDNTFTQDANTTTTLFNDNLSYAGYVEVQAAGTASTTYVEVLNSFEGFNFDYNQTVGIGATVVFPVLPGGVAILIGNTNQTSANSVEAYATYYY